MDDILVGQVPAELDQLRRLYLERQPKTVLEIGVYYGGTLREWLTYAAPNATVVAVDPHHLSPNLYAKWWKADTTVVIVDGRTEDETDMIQFHAPYDWVFVDGDHTEAAVRIDICLTLPLINPGGLLLIHDVVWDGDEWLPPRVCYEELLEDHDGWIIETERPESYPANCGHGIGVIQC